MKAWLNRNLVLGCPQCNIEKQNIILENMRREALLKKYGESGYLFWCESSIPILEDLNSKAGRASTGIDDAAFDDLTFVQAKRSQGNDASCLNINHVTVPPIIGIDPSEFITKGSFSFSDALKKADIKNPWQFLKATDNKNVIYGIADQSVLTWGLMINIGDTLIMRSENGMPLKIIIAAGLKSSVFQGNVLIGLNNFVKYFPSVTGTSMMLADGKPELADSYKALLNERFDNKGVVVEFAGERLASFNEVTNTYLSVFMVLGALGMIIGVAGLGFVLLKNYNMRKKEFALLLAVGFTVKNVRKMILSEQLILLLWGVIAGFASALISTYPSLAAGNELPWSLLVTMLVLVIATGFAALYISSRSVRKENLTSLLRKE